MSYLDLLNEKYPMRRTNEEKAAFRKYILQEVIAKGFAAGVEITGDGKNENIVIGDPLRAKVVCTAHYDTPASSLFPNLMIPRNKLLFLLYQFAPITLLLAVSLGGAFGLERVICAGETPDMRVVLLIYLALYYGIYFLMFRIFKNPNNFNDNTSGVATILSVMEKLTPQQRGEVAFILFDNEEKGKKGSKAYYKDHKAAMQERFLVNFDCVGNGEHIIFIAMKEAEKHAAYQSLQASFPAGNGFDTHFYPIKGSESNSDYKNFPCGVGCMACRKTKGGVFFTPDIHTPRDTVARNENIEFIADGMLRLIAALS